jgi:GT2 family glycosyltransferase
MNTPFYRAARKVLGSHSRWESGSGSRTVDVIVPVYRGLRETARCLESVLGSRQRIAFELVVVNDASPDEELADYLTGLQESGAITLISNERNLGFVESVNRGMALHADRDVVLLNSDAEVANDWLDRLNACAFRKNGIGTVTPFSNNATICSYPRLCAENRLPSGWDLGRLDRLFRTLNRGASIEIPTAVGFCMYIRRACLEDVGLFDAKTFGKGYGEENEFCMRARSAGWRHLLCGDTFVFHVGAVSFSGTQRARQADALSKLKNLYPEYEFEVRAHIEDDPARPLRLAVDRARLQQSPLPNLLFVTHGQGGGTDKHVRELAAILEGQANVLTLRRGTAGQFQLAWMSRDEAFQLFFALPKEYPELRDVLRSLAIARVHFHHVLGFDRTVWRLPRDLGVPYDFTVHDHYVICPRLWLADSTNRYCGEPDVKGCRQCLRVSPVPGVADILTWRSDHGKLLEGA